MLFLLLGFLIRGPLLGFPGGCDGEESACNAGDLGSAWVRTISWRRGRLPTPVFLPGEFHGQRSLMGCTSQGWT